MQRSPFVKMICYGAKYYLFPKKGSREISILEDLDSSAIFSISIRWPSVNKVVFSRGLVWDYFHEVLSDLQGCTSRRDSKHLVQHLFEEMMLIWHPSRKWSRASLWMHLLKFWLHIQWLDPKSDYLQVLAWFSMTLHFGPGVCHSPVHRYTAKWPWSLSLK